MAKQTETNVPHPTTIQFTAMYSFVKIGTNPPNTIAVNTSLDKSKKYFAKVSHCKISHFPTSTISRKLLSTALSLQAKPPTTSHAPEEKPRLQKRLS